MAAVVATGSADTMETRTGPSWVQHGRIPFLDGLRAIAIFLVVASHLCGRRQFDAVSEWVNGHTGVTLFFVISGFLITLLMLREHNKTGTVSLSAFYKRRALRIFPVYYAYLAFSGTLCAAGIIAFPAKYWLGALTYTMCYFPLASGWPIAHTWSLSVEEHFYLLWPLVLLLLRPQNAWRAALGYFLLAPVVRYFVWSRHCIWLDADYCSLTQMTSIAIGCVFAFMVCGVALPSLNKALTRNSSYTLLGGLLLLAVSTYAHRFGKYAILLGDPIDALAMALIIVALVHTNVQSLIGRALNCKPIVFLGVLSYSLYLWQQLFTSRLPAILRLPWYVAVGLLLLTAIASHYIIELPFLRLKDRKRSAAAG
jgi:peptidoglycan/LPS O-acetylase OafA/YrhL